MNGCKLAYRKRYLLRNFYSASFLFLGVACLPLHDAGAQAAASPTDGSANDSSNAPASQGGSAPSLNQQIAELSWLHGPTVVHIAGNSTFNLPQGFAILAPPDSNKFLQLNGNPTNPDDQNYIFWSESQNSTWFADAEYEDIGHVPDDQSIDPDQLLQQAKDYSAQENIVRKQQGMTELDLIGWASLPSFDEQTHRVEWAFNYSAPDGTKSEDFNTRILSRTGDLHVILVDDPTLINNDIPGFNAALDGFSFDQGQRYADYATGDKLAQYGIAGLIAGGATAVAVKSGFLAVVLGLLAASGKAVIAGIVAIFALIVGSIKRVFNRK